MPKFNELGILVPDKTVTVQIAGAQLTINQVIIPDNTRAAKNICSWVQKGDLVKPQRKVGIAGQPLGVCVHNTGMITTKPYTNPAEQYCRATILGNMGGVVVHYYIWRDQIWQLLDLQEQGWHAADGASRRQGNRGTLIGGNVDCIAIECIGNDPESERYTALLTAYLCQQFGLFPLLDVYSHQFFYPKKYCPCYILPHWDSFLQQVEQYGSEAVEMPQTPESKPDATTKHVVYQSKGIPRIRDKADYGGAELGRCKKGALYACDSLQGDWVQHYPDGGWSVTAEGGVALMAKTDMTWVPYTADANVNLRTGAGVNCPVVKVLPKGSRLAVIDGSAVSKDNYTWVKAVDSGRIVYAAKKYLIK